jgi:CDGSH-type Zn-finger protein
MRDKSSAAEISVTKDGPYLVAGELPLAKATIGANDEGESIRWEWGKPYPEQKNFALCRCGHSAHKPF